ncbi:P-loop containing nucleoside triphosphate hydrolase protein [Cristinia sonorae]|uniref:P-loop containing nucleoside triphosphate hydrolase protein n=1 Tax=Cristinia sonorae TaxID=1940300 RepID=A0A8K0XMI0_9AGAR|nr:P-loop containing nucleoside triphosphate hydrolase protein [Cristinia sonorae]
MDSQLSSSDSAYAQRRKEHLALINQLRAIGAQADLDLPRIVVIGNQSAGKSSLVEAISGITVPRDAGTCTRCPMECRLSSSSGAWQCQVSIRWEFNADGSACDEVREVPFGGIITNQSDVELALRRAQLAVLNPKDDPSIYIGMPKQQFKTKSKNALKFSRNIVCIDLAGPELTDLAFVDLPGIIQNAEPATVQLVEDMVRSHIKGNCLILVTIPMSDDIENQKAVRIAKQEDPLGSRTIGVMTKPDTLTSGATSARAMWLDVIEGRRYPLRHGYYCTRQPDDDERTNGITASAARQAEQDFFANNPPWSDSAHQQRFGTRNLITTLSKLLSQIIDEKLPTLQTQVSEQLLACTTRLSALPPPITTEPSAYVLSMVTGFCHAVQLLVQGDSDNSTLVQQNRRTYATFKSDVRSSAPRFVPFPSAKDSGAGGWTAENDEEDRDEGMEFVGKEGSLIYLEDVRKHISKSLTRELPNNVPYSAKLSLIRKTQESWEPSTKLCLEGVLKALESNVVRLVNTHFQRYDNLKSRLLHSIMDLFRSKHEETWKQIIFVLQCEGTPYTQNGHYLQVTKDKYLAKYKNARDGIAAFDDQPSPKRRKTTTSTATAPGTTTPQANGTGEFGVSPFDFSGQAAQQKRKATPLAATASKAAAIPAPTANSTSQLSSPLSSSLATPDATPAPAASPNPSANAFTFTPAPSPIGLASTTPTSGSLKRMAPEERTKLENEALSLLVKLGYTNTTVADFGKLVPPDVYEREMDVMAEVRAYFHVSYKRMIDSIPMTIDSMLLFAFARELQPWLIEKLGLGSSTSGARCASYLAEDPTIVHERDELMARKKRLESVQMELFNAGL